MMIPKMEICDLHVLNQLNLLFTLLGLIYLLQLFVIEIIIVLAGRLESGGIRS